MPNIRQACFFNALKIVAKLPLFFMKKSFIVVYERQVVQSGTKPSLSEKGSSMLFLPKRRTRAKCVVVIAILS